MKLRTWIFLLPFACVPAWASAADHRVEPLDEAPPADGVAAEIHEQLGPSAQRVIRGTSRTVCDVWLAKSWTTRADFEPSAAVIYPFEAGQLLGLVRYKSKSTDFRGQTIAPGIYVMRYGLQPVDGNHVGTSVIRDFILLTPADKDASAAPMDEKALAKLSAEVAGGTHPTMLSLRHAPDDAAALPAMRHEDEGDLWILEAAGQATSGDALPVAVVLVGQSE